MVFVFIKLLILGAEKQRPVEFRSAINKQAKWKEAAGNFSQERSDARAAGVLTQ
jgi:hypothetical protein